MLIFLSLSALFLLPFLGSSALWSGLLNSFCLLSWWDFCYPLGLAFSFCLLSVLGTVSFCSQLAREELTFSTGEFFFNLGHSFWHVPTHRVSKCHSHTVVRPRKNFLTLRKILWFLCPNLKKITSFTVFSSWFPHDMGFLCDFFTFSCAKFLNYSFDGTKNLLLECLPTQAWVIGRYFTKVLFSDSHQVVWDQDTPVGTVWRPGSWGS